MSVWQRAEDMLKAIQGDLDRESPDWGSAIRSTANVQALVPDFPLFKELQDGQPPPKVDWRIVELRNDLGHMELGLTKRDRDLALGNVQSVIRKVQALGRKEA